MTKKKDSLQKKIKNHRWDGTRDNLQEIIDRYLKVLRRAEKMDKGCWIMVIKKVSCECAPPPLSIHFSYLWPMEKAIPSQVKKHNSEFNFPFGEEPNYGTARKILFNGKEVRLFDHEFTVLTAEKMNLFIQGENGGDCSHVFKSGQSLAEKTIETEIVSGDKKEIYDAALVDGATDEQAFLVSLGKDPLVLDEFPPAIGWYECKPEYLKYYF